MLASLGCAAGGLRGHLGGSYVAVEVLRDSVGIMNTIVTILVKESAGLLAAVVLKLSPKGYRLESHKKTQAESGAERIQLFLKCPSTDLEEIEGDLQSLEHGIQIEGIEQAKTSAAIDEAVRTEKEVLGDIARAFPDVAGIVRKHGRALSAETRAKTLFDLGHKTGRATYKRDFSLGSPLKLPAAWRRVIVPAVRNFGETKAGDDMVTLQNCPFCAIGSDSSCCDFVTGFVQGLLDAGAYTQGKTVREAACKSKGSEGCTFVIES